MARMRTVASLLVDVYGSDAEAALKLGVVRSAVCNWKDRGHFPARLTVRIWKDAKARGLKIGVEDIPAFGSNQ